MYVIKYKANKGIVVVVVVVVVGRHVARDLSKQLLFLVLAPRRICQVRSRDFFFQCRWLSRLANRSKQTNQPRTHFTQLLIVLRVTESRH